LVLEDWDVQVDPDSISSPFRSEYQPGNLAVSENQFYFAVSHRYSIQFIGLDGGQKKAASADFIFTNWKILAGSKEARFQFWPFEHT
tara:strand:+ start:15082 stop:15342 length:261 start_codon:yes stop_codon:yes gene_type:complete